MKICSKCKITKYLTEFNKKSKHKDGHNSQCKNCRKQYTADYYINNKNKIQIISKKYYQDNKAKFLKNNKEYRNRIKQERSDFYINLKRKPCMDCHNTFDPECMDFDHRPNETKSFDISKYAGGGQTRISKNKILNEVQKCDLVCANCHRLRTKNRRLAKISNILKLNQPT